MGPRPRGRGIGSTAGPFTFGIVLQWGRDRAVAELLIALGGFLDSVALQWGRDRAVAELATTHQGTLLLRRFNGAATARSRNFDIAAHLRHNQDGFNGAATARSRN